MTPAKQALEDFLDRLGGLAFGAEVLSSAPEPRVQVTLRGAEEGYFHASFDAAGLVRVWGETRTKQIDIEEMHPFYAAIFVRVWLGLEDLRVSFPRQGSITMRSTYD